MANPRLDGVQLKLANELLTDIRKRLDELSGGNQALRFALNRKIAKELIYDERSKPAVRRKLKIQKHKEQLGKCAVCSLELPDKGAVLDRYSAIDGYIARNTRLICASCDTLIQSGRKYT